MQFYLNGYKPGDPFIEDPHPSVAERPEGLPEDVDVLIIGCGPAGLVLAAQMASFPDIRTAVIDRKDGPLEVGQADGVACRTVEMFEAFGLADRLVNEAYWVNEVCFWRPDPEDQTKIKRTGRIQDTEEGLSEFPHVIVNQARMLAYLRDHMERSASRLAPFYGLHASDVEIDTSGSSEYPVTVTLQHLKDLAGNRGDLDHPGQVCRRLRRLAQRHPDRDRPRAGRRRDERVLGRDGRPGGHRLPGHPASSARSTPRTRATSSSSRARAGTWSGSTSSWTRSATRRCSTTGALPPRSWPRSRIGSCTRTRSRSRTSGGGRCTRSASVCATSSTTCRRRRWPPACRGCSSPAMPATRTAPRPVRA